MGQKVHPYSFRIGVVNDWKSKWYSDRDYVALVNEDWRIRDYLRGELTRGAVSRIDVERTRDRLIVDIHTARPGVVIGRRGAEAERLRTGLEALTKRPVKLNINEVKDPDLDAQLLARGIADQIENRIAFRRAMKRAVASAVKAGAEGVRVESNGRLGGSDMGRREWYREGRVPLHTLRADIDFGTATARTNVGAVGVKVWVYKGDVIERAGTSGDRIAAEADLATGGPARRRQRSLKTRAEQALEGAERSTRLIEAGGGKRLIEAGGGRREGGRRVIEAGGGRRPTAAEAKVEYDNAREEVTVDPDAPVAEAVTEVEETGTEAAVSEAAVEGAVPEEVHELADEVVSAPDTDAPTPEQVEAVVDDREEAILEPAPSVEPEEEAVEAAAADLAADDASEVAREVEGDRPEAEAAEEAARADASEDEVDEDKV